MELRGTNALLTGAGGGLGQYIGRALAAEGVNLALSDLPAADTSVGALVEELRATGARAVSLPADLTDTGGLAQLVEHAGEEVGALDILVNNAGLEFVGAFAKHSREELEAITAVNLLAVMELTRVVLPGMLERGRGHVVNIASVAGKVPLGYFSSYNATKHGVVGFTHAMRGEYVDGPIGFSAICPGFITRVGMYGRVQDEVEIPRALGTLPPEAVGRAVVRAIRNDVPEVVVNKRPLRPLIALASVLPGVAQRINRRVGALAAARRHAEIHGRL